MKPRFINGNRQWKDDMVTDNRPEMIRRLGYHVDLKINP